MSGPLFTGLGAPGAWEIKEKEMAEYSKEFIRDLIRGRLDDLTVKAVRSNPKDRDRFQKYLEILQEETGFSERILLPLGEHLYIVQRGNERIVKAGCGHELGDYRVNWKLHALLYVRETEEALEEIYAGPRKGLRPGMAEVREFYCPGCGIQLEVECVPPGYPITFDFLPDIDGFYQEWLGLPLGERQPVEDHTCQVTRGWAKSSS